MEQQQQGKEMGDEVIPEKITSQQITKFLDTIKDYPKWKDEERVAFLKVIYSKYGKDFDFENINYFVRLLKHFLEHSVDSSLRSIITKLWLELIVSDELSRNINDSVARRIERLLSGNSRANRITGVRI